MRPHRRTGYEITDQQWQRIAHLLPGKSGDVGHTAADNRLFINAVLWIAGSGAPWRDLPERVGLWNSSYQRFRRWAKADVWRKVFEELQEPDLDWMMIDSIVVRAHQHASPSFVMKRWRVCKGKPCLADQTTWFTCAVGSCTATSAE